MFICYSCILKKKNVYKPGAQKTQVKLLIKKKKENKNKPKLSSSSFRLYQKKNGYNMASLSHHFQAKTRNKNFFHFEVDHIHPPLQLAPVV